MLHNSFSKDDQISLAIHSTDNSFGFGSRINNDEQTDSFFIKKFDYDLCNNLVFDFNKFISSENLKKVHKLSVSVGPANFNASRLIVVLARTISQQINCEVESFSCFKLMAKRIALNNNFHKIDKFFWIYKKLKRRGYIAGRYKFCISSPKNGSPEIEEKVIPKLLEELCHQEPYFQADYDDQRDLKQLLNLSNINRKNSKFNSWKKILPIYPISPIN